MSLRGNTRRILRKSKNGFLRFEKVAFAFWKRPQTFPSRCVQNNESSINLQTYKISKIPNVLLKTLRKLYFCRPSFVPTGFVGFGRMLKVIEKAEKVASPSGFPTTQNDDLPLSKNDNWNNILSHSPFSQNYSKTTCNFVKAKIIQNQNFFTSSLKHGFP